MKYVVLLKQVYDTETKITLDANGTISNSGITLIMNPYDEYAVEEALRLKEKGEGEVTVVSAGGQQVQDALRQALAMGADKAVLVDSEGADLDEYATAIILAKAIENIGFDVILGGFRAIDDGSAQVAGRVAEILKVPVVNVITKLEVEGSQATATREIEGGSEVVEVSLPAVFTAQKGLNEPRYPSMKGIMKAKKKPMDKKTLADLGLDNDQIAARVKPISFSLPEARKAGRVIPGEPGQAAAELAKLLREEAKVI
ncbi:MAG: electron transfer flavoprotein subunit beta [Desulfotomaculum sp. BICA1-6]|nr:MAG: electron transfer flavoprotein subunit beta [Peptococcaceae bacterium BRH_c8a]KJS73513.1 MAG: electron transfer flavoprotein subunit beta [Desulfotomaculum sp. BICA1-6]